MKLYIMTGPFMTGKTTWIERLLLACGLPIASRNPALAGLEPATPGSTNPLPRVAGVYTPAVFEGAEKTAIDATLLPSCERFLFAPRRLVRDEQGTHFAGWDFQSGALQRINAHLAGCADCELLVVDELGPLELLRGQGYTEALRLLDAAAVPCALLVVRPDLLPQAEARWGAFEQLGPDASMEGFLAQLRA